MRMFEEPDSQANGETCVFISGTRIAAHLPCQERVQQVDVKHFPSDCPFPRAEYHHDAASEPPGLPVHSAPIMSKLAYDGHDAALLSLP
jgi:hypothetical protein